MQRREFLLGASMAALLNACGQPAVFSSKPPLPPGTLTEPARLLGHRLRQKDFPAPTETRRVAVVIAGGGIGGLSAGWRLQHAGCDDFLLLEMESSVGGNSRAGSNAVAPYPLGAHYLPLPPPEARAVRRLLRELNVLKPDGQYDEAYLCHAPQERLYRDGYWHDGLLPSLGLGASERAEHARFHDQIAELRSTRDHAGRRPFALPMALSSREAAWRATDRSNFRDWLLQNGYTSPALHWLADYACRDDYGTRAAETSAWAGLHYFSCREGEGQVLTTPGGNAWLTDGLKQGLKQGMEGTRSAQLQADAVLWRVTETRHQVACDVYLAAENRSIRILARELIWAAPLFLIPHVFVPPRPEWLAALAGIEYAPWVVVNLTLSAPPETRAGVPLAWDNVLYDSPALGYVVATHQQLRYAPAPTVITWYRALHEESVRSPATPLLQMDRAAWAEAALRDLERAHPEIRQTATRIDVHRHAHAMIRPRPGSLWDGRREVFTRNHGRVRFAHADVSGFSLFEEANHRGVLAAERTLTRLGVSFNTFL